MTAQGLKTALVQRYAFMKANCEQLLKPIESPGMNPYKQVELWKKWRPIIPNDFWNDEFYQKPSPEVLALVVKEKKSRKVFRGELNKMKSQEIRKEKIKQELNKLTGDDKEQKGEQLLEHVAQDECKTPETKKAKVTEEEGSLKC